MVIGMYSAQKGIIQKLCRKTRYIHIYREKERKRVLSQLENGNVRYPKENNAHGMSRYTLYYQFMYSFSLQLQVSTTHYKLKRKQVYMVCTTRYCFFDKYKVKESSGGFVFGYGLVGL